MLVAAVEVPSLPCIADLQSAGNEVALCRAVGKVLDAGFFLGGSPVLIVFELDKIVFVNGIHRAQFARFKALGFLFELAIVVLLGNGWKFVGVGH